MRPNSLTVKLAKRDSHQTWVSQLLPWKTNSKVPWLFDIRHACCRKHKVLHQSIDTCGGGYATNLISELEKQVKKLSVATNATLIPLHCSTCHFPILIHDVANVLSDISKCRPPRARYQHHWYKIHHKFLKLFEASKGHHRAASLARDIKATKSTLEKKFGSLV